MTKTPALPHVRMNLPPANCCSPSMYIKLLVLMIAEISLRSQIDFTIRKK